MTEIIRLASNEGGEAEERQCAAKPFYVKPCADESCQLYMENHHGNKSLGMSIKLFLDCLIEWERPTLNINDSIPGLGANAEGKGERGLRTSIQALPASLLHIPCPCLW